MKSLFSRIWTTDGQQLTKKFELNEGGVLQKGTFSSPSEFSMATVLASETANECIMQIETAIDEGYGIMLGHHQYHAESESEMHILPRWKFEQCRGLTNEKFNVKERLLGAPIGTRTKLNSKNRSASSNDDKTNCQNSRLVVFDVDYADITYTEREAHLMDTVDNYVAFLHDIMPEVGFDIAAYFATASTSAKVKRPGDIDKPFDELTKKGFHLYFVLAENTLGTDHTRLEETLKSRLFDYGLMRVIPRKHSFTSKVKEELSEEEQALYGLPNGTLFVSSEVIDMSTIGDINRLIFEANPIIPECHSIHTDIRKTRKGEFISLNALPLERTCEKDREVVKAAFRHEILDRPWYDYSGTRFTQEAVKNHVDNTSFNVIDSEITYTLEPEETLTFAKALNGKTVWTILDLYNEVSSSNKYLDELCEYSGLEGRTAKFQSSKNKFTVFIPRLKMYIRLSAHTESLLYAEGQVNHFDDLDIELIDDTGNPYNLNLTKAINEGRATKIVSKALHSTGKSTAMVALAKRNNAFSVIVAPLKSLVSNLIAKFAEEGMALFNYEDFSKGEMDFSKFDGIAVCAPSLRKVLPAVTQLNGRKLNFMIDEVEFTLKAIHSSPERGEEIIYAKPEETMYFIQELLSLADTYLIADADAGAATRDLMECADKDFVLHQNNSQKKLNVPAYINRFTKEGWEAVKAKVQSMIAENYRIGKRTIICSATKQALTDVLSSVTDAKVALVASRNGKNDSEQTVRLIKEGDYFLSNPVDNQFEYDVIALSPKASNGLDLTLVEDGVSLDAELIYLHRGVNNYSTEVVVQHLLRLRGPRPMHVFLSDFIPPINRPTDQSAVAMLLKRNKAIADIDNVDEVGLQEVARRTAMYNGMLNDDSHAFSQRLFGYLARIGFDLLTTDYCIDNQRGLPGSPQYLWSGEDAQMKWNDVVLDTSRDELTASAYGRAMSSYFWRNSIGFNYGRRVPFTNFHIVMIMDVLDKYQGKFGGSLVNTIMGEIESVSIGKGYKINTSGKRVGGTIDVPVVNYLVNDNKPEPKLRNICKALGYNFGTSKTRVPVQGMTDEEQVQVSGEQIRVKELVKVDVGRLMYDVIKTVGDGIESFRYEPPEDFISDWLGYEDCLRDIVLVEPKIDPVEV